MRASYTPRRRSFSLTSSTISRRSHFFTNIAHIRLLELCALQEEVANIIYHCHTSLVGGHFGATRIAAKVLQCGFYWSTIFKYANDYVRKCNECQRTGNVSRKHEMPLNNILAVELFDIWGVDFHGPFSYFLWQRIHPRGG